MRFEVLSKFLLSVLPGFKSKVDLAAKLGVERRKLETMLYEPNGAISYEEGKTVEDFARARILESKPSAAALAHVVTASLPYDVDPNLRDIFAVAYWPSENLMIVKAVGGPLGGVLPNRSTEERALIAVKALALARIRVDLKKVNFYEVQRLSEDRTLVSQIQGLSNKMDGLVASYVSPLPEEISQEILIRAEWF